MQWIREPKGDAHPVLRKDRFVWAIALALAALQATLLIRGYRITGDDVTFYEAALHGLAASMELTQAIAAGQGRIGAYIIIPINIASAYLSDWLAFRLLAVLLYFLAFFLFSGWVQKLLGKPVAAAIFLFLVVFNINDYMHLPPVSYPLQNTIPFLAIIGARLHLLRQDSGEGASKRRAGHVGALAAFGAGMVASEYGFLLGTAMLGSEYLRDALRGGKLSAGMRLAFSRAYWPSLLVCLLVLAAYIFWRLAFPSNYDGNQLAPLTRLPHGLLTATAHILTPYALPYGSFQRPLGYPGGVWPMAALAVGIAAAAGFLAARPSLAAIRRPLTIMAIALLAAFYTVLPASMTLKQQIACFEHLGCAFLDSQIAYLATAVAGAAGVAWLITRPGTDVGQKRLTLFLSVLVGVGAAFAFYHNKRVSDDMQRLADVWQAAVHTACRNDLPVGKLDSIFDPEAALNTYPGFDREAFWQAFVLEHPAACR